MSPLLLHSNTNQYNINGLLCTYTEMFRIQTCCNHILSAAEEFRGQEATCADQGIFVSLFSPQLILQFIEGSNGFIAEKAILILYQGSRGSLIFQGGGGCPTFSRGVQMLISIETLIALVIFQGGGVRTPIPLWIRTWAMSS